MSQTVEVEPYEEIVEAVHYNTPGGSRSSSPQGSPRRSSPHLFLSNDPIQRNSLFAAPARPALGSTELAISEPWRGSATTVHRIRICKNTVERERKGACSSSDFRHILRQKFVVCISKCFQLQGAKGLLVYQEGVEWDMLPTISRMY